MFKFTGSLVLSLSLAIALAGVMIIGGRIWSSAFRSTLNFDRHGMVQPPTVQDFIDQVREEFPQVPAVQVDQLQKLLESQEEVILVDVRTDQEQAVSMIPGAIAPEQLSMQLEQSPEATVIAYCTIGYRSAQYVQQLQEQGISALNLEGSLLSWIEHQGPLEHEGEATNRVHVYGKRWSIVPEGYVPVY